VQLGVRMEVRLVEVLKGPAEFNDETLGELLEKIVLHSFQPVPGDEGESSASPHGKAALRAIEDLKRVYGLDYETYSARLPQAVQAGMTQLPGSCGLDRRLRAHSREVVPINGGVRATRS
jgi:hypothetical protein